jgi:hypothetical protein
MRIQRKHASIIAAVLVIAVVGTGIVMQTAGTAIPRAGATGAAASTNCKVLSVGSIPAGALETAYRTLTHLGSKTALVASEPRRYGSCGTTNYAFDLFTVAKGVKLTPSQLIAQENHSPVWHQVAGQKWVESGLASLCKLAPHALINLWNVGVGCAKS